MCLSIRFGAALSLTLPMHSSAQVVVQLATLSAALSVGVASQVMAGSNQIVSESRRLNASLWAGQFLVL
jgi:hypothetical protein